MSKRAAQDVRKFAMFGLLFALCVGCDRNPGHHSDEGSPAGLSDGSSPSDESGLPSVSDTDDTAPIDQQATPGAGPGSGPGSTGDDSGTPGNVVCPENGCSDSGATGGGTTGGETGTSGSQPGTVGDDTGSETGTSGSQPGTVGDDTGGSVVIPNGPEDISSLIPPGPERCIVPADQVEQENGRVITDVVDLELNCKLYLYRQGRTADALACFFHFLNGDPTTRTSCDCTCIAE